MHCERDVSESKSFNLLDERLRHWVWRHEWVSFRGVQEDAIPAILENKNDVVLAASTSSGKTEAAFLPVISKMLLLHDTGGVKGNFGLTVYISPLTALINDQIYRVTELCGSLKIPVYPWHGGIAANVKKKFFENPQGILLITPESLQAIFCNHGAQLPAMFGGLRYIIIDELHSFIGSERGKQLQSLMHMLDIRTGKTITRIGLSATLGDMNAASIFLRGGEKTKRKCSVIQDGNGNFKMKLLLKGITEDKNIEPMNESDDDEEDEDAQTESKMEQTSVDTFSAPHAIAEYLFQKLRGTNNLIFPNTRTNVEFYTHLLSALCSAYGYPNEFFAHHGNLSKEIKEEAEDALRSTEHSATVICTNTMEMGIDIGEIASVVQIEAPPSVASLRQRIGRAGRREGEVPVLRAFTIEEALKNNNHLFARLRESTFQFCASIMLLLEGWCEPPKPHGMHLSTLVQQLLALVAERSGIRPSDAYQILCVSGPFEQLSETDFEDLIENLIMLDILDEAENLLLFADKGEKLANHYTFFAAFSQDIEYRIVTGEKTLGTIPIKSNMQAGDVLIFAGLTWKIKSIDDRAKIIEVKYFKSGRPPLFTGSGFSIHPAIRNRMKILYENDEPIPFADANAKLLLEQGRETYKNLNLDDPKNRIIERGANTIVLTFLGDKANKTLQLLLRNLEISNYTCGLGINTHGKDKKEIEEILFKLKENKFPPTEKLLHGRQNLYVEKWDKFLPHNLLVKNYASLYLAPEEVREWLGTLL
ncbi:MAG: DEAD/DEAH box helicase [Termitinemataceae bacterium]|nr:MAG: DEAD/DEAH box helicase [Termitinemataceae bacterium]